MSDGIVVRKCTTLPEFEACVTLQRDVWGEEDLEIEPVTGFLVASETGGQVLGAYDGDKLVGYTLGVIGYRDGVIFIHSHHTGVHHDYRDRGVGRQLKLFQREEALSRDIRYVQWTFDPLELRNAHFNLNRLGGISRQYKPNLYGITSSPLHRGLATDRLLVEWHLDSKRVVAAISNLLTGPSSVEIGARIELPVELEQWKQTDVTATRKVQGRDSQRIHGITLIAVTAAIGTRKTSAGTAYVLVPWSEFFKVSLWSLRKSKVEISLAMFGTFRRTFPNACRIREITLREIGMKLIAPFEISSGVAHHRRIILLEANVDGVTGWAECVAGENPNYSPETVETAWHILRDHLWPLIKDRDFAAAADVYDMLELVRGHNMAKGGLEAAVWDAEAKQKGIPLWKLLGGSRTEIASGVSIGIKDSLDTLAATVKKELDAGYQRIKIKVKPGKDLEQVKRLRQDFPKIKLTVDANSAYTLADWELLKQLDAFYLMMIEQPLGWDDLYSHAELQKKLNTPICLDECIHDLEHARAAIALGACKIINIKLGRVGGHTMVRRIHDLCEKSGIPVWCGGMLESGIGRAHNIALSTLPNFTLPGDVSASKRYWVEDIIEPEVVVSSRGTIAVPTAPGIGYNLKMDLVDRLTTRTEKLV